MNLRLAILLAMFLSLFHPATTLGQWQLDGTPVSATVFDQISPEMVTDGAGGVMVAWQDYRNGSNSDIFAQRINAAGVVQWATNGVELSTVINSQIEIEITSDGAGGAIVTWQDSRTGIYDIYVQRINAAGVVQWADDGLAICVAADHQVFPAMVSDGAGGAIVTWQDLRNGVDYNIYAQRVNAAGVTQWAFNGVVICGAGVDQQFPTITSDGAAGAVVTWIDNRGGATAADIYAQRINAAGAVQWTAHGVAVCTAANAQLGPVIVSATAGGAIVAWYDNRGAAYDIYAQRMNALGAMQWTTNGVALCTAANDQTGPAIVSDGSAGAIVTWSDARNGAVNYDIYAQRISLAGAVQWIPNGVALCAAADDQSVPTLVSDGSGGAIVTWYDYRNGSTDSDVYAQRIDALGAVQWTTNGLVLGSAASHQVYPIIVSGGAGSAIVAWRDSRTGNADVYAQRLEGVYGYWGHPEPIVTSVADIQNDQGGKVALNWTASGRDRPVPATIDFYSVWRAVDVAPFGASAEITPLERIGLHTPAGARTKIPSSPYYWELVGSQTAYRLPYYSFSAATRADSVAGDAGDEFFMVMAHDQTDEHIAFPSNAVSGHSVDNLAPAAPLLLTAQRVGADVHLEWNGVHVVDLRDYSVYRATSSGVSPVPINFLSSSDDTVLVDASAPTSALYYIVTAYDVHANQSAPSNEAAVSPSTSVGNTPAISQLTVLPNSPNPFAETTELQVGLPAASDISVDVYDVVGRRVSSFEVERAAAGWRKVPFSARDSSGRALASGVYFYRVTANGSTITQKMVIAR